MSSAGMDIPDLHSSIFPSPKSDIGSIDVSGRHKSCASENQQINNTIEVLLKLYAALAAPTLPKAVLEMLNRTMGRITAGFLTVYVATKDTDVAPHLNRLNYHDSNSKYNELL